MPVNFHEVDVRQTIDEPGRSDVAHTPKVIGVNFVDSSAGELFRTFGNGIEHLIGAVEVMNGAEDEIEFVPVSFHPGTSSRRSFGIVIQLNASTDFYVGIATAQQFDLIEIDTGMIAIVIGKGDVNQPENARAIDPWLQQFLGVALNAVPLRVRVIIREERRHGAVRNFCCTCNSGYAGKKTSAV